MSRVSQLYFPHSFELVSQLYRCDSPLTANAGNSGSVDIASGSSSSGSGGDVAITVGSGTSIGGGDISGRLAYHLKQLEGKRLLR